MIPRSLFHPGCLSVLRHGLLCSISFFFFPPCILLRVELHSSGLILFVLNSRSMERSICKLWKWELLDFYHTEKDKCPTPSQVCHSVQGNKICSETSCRVARSISCHHLKRAWPPSRERNTAAKLFTTQLKKKKRKKFFWEWESVGQCMSNWVGLNELFTVFPGTILCDRGLHHLAGSCQWISDYIPLYQLWTSYICIYELWLAVLWRTVRCAVGLSKNDVGSQCAAHQGDQ